jgi:uncharacterized membrane-anchored protein
VAILAYWRLTEASLSVTHIRTFKVEVLYWVAILFSNTLGTALGDFLSDDSGLGFAGSALLIGSLIAVVAAAASFTNISKVLLFWVAFVLTRPFGATVGDVLTKSHERGGVGFGTVGSSVVLAAILGATLVYATFAQQRQAALARADT